ncbi:MAG: type II secretion system F family protein [Bacilli bacterium]|nr:type II secretion system F family protein [Bacilli bacterium]
MQLRNYRYEAIDLNGKLIKGYFETINKYTCVKYLESKNLKVKSIVDKSNIITKLNQVVINNVLPKKQLVFFLKQLGALLNAGIDIVSSLELLALQQTNRHQRRLFFELNQSVFNGYSFSMALAEHPKEFPNMLIQMMEIGELSGKLPETILKMADYYEKQIKLSSSIKSAIRMPLIYLGATLLIAVGMILFVFPSITGLFESLNNAQLPGITQFFLNISDFMGQHSLTILIVVVVLVVGISLLYKYEKNTHKAINIILLKSPIFGQLIEIYNQIMIANSLAQMMANGVNTILALKTIRDLVNNVVYKDIINKTLDYIRDGQPFSKAFLESDFIDPVMSKMISTGETIGDIPNLMSNLATYYNDVSELRIEKLKNAIQPILLIIVYAIVGVLLLAIMLPMLSLGEQI